TPDPAVGVSRPPISPRSVDLPLPEGPVTATTSPAATSRLTPARIVTGRPPLDRRITRSRTRIIPTAILHSTRDLAPRRQRAPRRARDPARTVAGPGRAARPRRAGRQPHRRPGRRPRRGLPGRARGAAPRSRLRLPCRQRRHQRRYERGGSGAPRLGV